MADEVRKIGEYKVTNSLHMGDREYALCENMDDPHGLYYMTCVVRANDFYEFYDGFFPVTIICRLQSCSRTEFRLPLRSSSKRLKSIPPD